MQVRRLRVLYIGTFSVFSPNKAKAVLLVYKLLMSRSWRQRAQESFEEKLRTPQAWRGCRMATVTSIWIIRRTVGMG